MITSMILMVVGGLTTFDTVLILTQGGPGTDTTIAPTTCTTGFKSFDFGCRGDRHGPGRRRHRHLADRGPGLRLRQDAAPGRACDEMSSDTRPEAPPCLPRSDAVGPPPPPQVLGQPTGRAGLAGLARHRGPAAVRDARASLQHQRRATRRRPAGLPDHLTLDNYSTGTSPTASPRTSSTRPWSPRPPWRIVLLLRCPSAVRDRAQPAAGSPRRLPALPARPGDPRAGGDRADVLRDQQGRAVRQPDRRHPADRRVLAAGVRADPQRRDARHHLGAVRGDGDGRRLARGGCSSSWCCRCPRAASSTIVVFSALQAWNGFLFPLVLTQSELHQGASPWACTTSRPSTASTSPACWPRWCCRCCPIFARLPVRPPGPGPGADGRGRKVPPTPPHHRL